MFRIIKQRNTGFCDLAWSPQICAHSISTTKSLLIMCDSLVTTSSKEPEKSHSISPSYRDIFWLPFDSSRSTYDIPKTWVHVSQVVQCLLPPIPENSSRFQYGCKNIISIIESSSKVYHRHFGATWLLKTTLVEATSLSGSQVLSNMTFGCVLHMRNTVLIASMTLIIP